MSRDALAGTWRFAGGMLSITFLALILTQMDKLLLVRLLPLETFGYYALAAALAAVISMMVNPVAQSVYPRMVELLTQQDDSGLVAIYHQSAQLITVLTVPVAFLLSFFAQGVIFVWSGDNHLAGNASPILSVIVFGNFLNGLMLIPYHLQIADGWTLLTIQINTVAAVLFIPAIFLIFPRFGPVGVAWIWVVLNLCYVVIGIQLMHRRLIPSEKWRWYFADVLLPSIACLGVVLSATLIQPQGYNNRFLWMAFLFIVACVSFLFSLFLSSSLRTQIYFLLEPKLKFLLKKYGLQ
jgi:O-antigen/teichoic acid export membrane protein